MDQATEQPADGVEAGILARFDALKVEGYEEEVGLVALLGKGWAERPRERRALLRLRMRGVVDSPQPGFFVDRRRRQS